MGKRGELFDILGWEGEGGMDGGQAVVCLIDRLILPDKELGLIQMGKAIVEKLAGIWRTIAILDQKCIKKIKMNA